MNQPCPERTIEIKLPISIQNKLKLNETIEQDNDRSIDTAQNLFDKLYDLI